MPIISVPQDFNEERLYVDLRAIFGKSLFLKCEAFNFAGSVKLKPKAPCSSMSLRAASSSTSLRLPW